MDSLFCCSTSGRASGNATFGAAMVKPERALVQGKRVTRSKREEPSCTWVLFTTLQMQPGESGEKIAALLLLPSAINTTNIAEHKGTTVIFATLRDPGLSGC